MAGFASGGATSPAPIPPGPFATPAPAVPPAPPGPFATPAPSVPPSPPGPFATPTPTPPVPPTQRPAPGIVGRQPERHLLPVGPGLEPVVPQRTRPVARSTVDWLLRDLGLAVAGALVVTVAWLVLVVLRLPEAGVVADPLTAQLDDAVADTLRADRITAFGTWIGNVASILVLGGFVFHAFVSRRRDRAIPWSPRWILRVAAVAGSTASLAVLPFRAAAVAGTARVIATDPSTLYFVLTTRFGSAALLRTAGLVITAFAVTDLPAVAAVAAIGAVDEPLRRPDRSHGPRQRRRARYVRGSFSNYALGITGVALVLASYAWVGHPQATRAPGPLLIVSQSIHILAVATWFGGVTLLLFQIRAGRRAGAVRTSAELVARFSTVAGLAVAVTVATGMALARSQVRSLDALTSTPYGRALLLKLAFVGLVLAIGGYNKHVVVPKIVEQRGRAAWRTLHRTLLAEAFLIAGGIVLATTAMTSGGI